MDATDLKALAQEIGTVIVGLMSDLKDGETRSMRLDAAGVRWLVSITRLTAGLPPATGGPTPPTE